MNKKTFSLFVRRRSVRAIVLLAIAAPARLPRAMTKRQTATACRTASTP